MAKMIQIRNVPDDTHAELKARAAGEGLSMSDLVLREIDRLLARPPRQQLLDHLAHLPPAQVDLDPTAVLREERDA